MPKSIIPCQGIALAVDPFRRKQAKYRLFIYGIDFLVRPTSRVTVAPLAARKVEPVVMSVFFIGLYRKRLLIAFEARLAIQK